MSNLIISSLLICLALSTTLLIRPRNLVNLVLNPAAYVLVVFIYSILVKTIYIAWIHEPQFDPVDRIFGLRNSIDFLWAGLWLAGVAAAGYILGFFATGNFIPGYFKAGDHSLQAKMLPVSGVALTSIGFAISFVLFVVIGEHSLFGNLSEKRFLPGLNDGASRFALPEYYFFKISTLSLPLSVVAGYFWLKTEKKVWGLLFCALFVFAFSITVFASIRLIFLIMCIQLLLLVWISENRKYWLIATLCLAMGLHAAATTLLRDKGAAPIVVAPQTQPDTATTPRRQSKIERAAHLVLRGRYFMDLAKLGHIAEYFPAQRDYLHGTSYLGVPVTTPSTLSEVLPEKEKNYRGWNAAWGGDDVAPGSEVRMRFNNFLAIYLFREPSNNVTSFIGRLYADFGLIGIMIVLVLIGMLHRVLRNVLLHPNVKWWVYIGGIFMLPTTTLLLFNSGPVTAFFGILTDLIVIPICLVLGYFWKHFNKTLASQA